MDKRTVALVVAIAVAGIIFYLGEENTTLVLLALGGLAYLVFSGSLKIAGVA